MFADPEKIIKQFELREGMHVADLGAGVGSYSIPAAKAVTGHPTGKIYAIEIQKDMLTRLKNEAEKTHIKNIEIIWGNIEKIGGTKLADNSVDAVIASNILFQVEDKKTCIDEIKRILKPGGHALVIDWSDSFGGMGPEKKKIVPRMASLHLFEKAGFSLEGDVAAGEHHYGVILRKM